MPINREVAKEYNVYLADKLKAVFKAFSRNKSGLYKMHLYNQGRVLKPRWSTKKH